MAFHNYALGFLPECPAPSSFLNSLKEQIKSALDQNLSSVGNFSPRPQEIHDLEASLTPQILASFIDHTILKPDATETDLGRACEEAQSFGFKSVCVNSSQIAFIADQLKSSTVLPIAVVGFPNGMASWEAKAFEANVAITQGAREIDMVLNRGSLKQRDYARVFQDIYAVVQATHPYPVKVILESTVLSLEEKIVACVIAREAGAAFVKTSTGFAGGGATLEDVALMRKVVGSQIGVKASGGIRSRKDAIKMIHAGANRIGASASVVIVGNNYPAGDDSTVY